MPGDDSGTIRQLLAEERRQQDLAAQAAAAPVPYQVVQLAGPTGVTASAALTPQAWGTSIDFAASGLEPLRSYGVWVEVRGGGRVSAGTIQPGTTGAVRVSLHSPVPLGDCLAFGLTLLPRAGETAGTDIVATQL